MRIVLTYCFLLLASCKIIKLDYEPKRHIVQFNYEGLKIYTDTSAIFDIADSYKDSIYAARTRKIILEKVDKSKNDTISFNGSFIPFNSIVNTYKIVLIVHDLTEKNYVKIFDKANRQVETIKIKKIRNKGDFGCIVKRVYINQDTKEELFRELLKKKIFLPAW